MSGVFDALVTDCPLDRTSPERPLQPRRAGHAGAVRAGGSQALCARDDVEGRRGAAGAVEHREDPERGRRAQGAGGDQGGGGHSLVSVISTTAPSRCWARAGCSTPTHTTIKPLYGHQEGAVLGYNPEKPGRPSHTYHSFFLSNLRLVLDVDVMAGNQHAANHAGPGLWALSIASAATVVCVLAARRQGLRLRRAHGRLREGGLGLSHAAAPDRATSARSSGSLGGAAGRMRARVGRASTPR